MVPFDPTEPVPGRMPGGLHVEVTAFADALRPQLACRIDDGDRIDVLIRMDISDPLAIRRDHRGRGRAEGRRNWPRAARIQLLAVDALVELADEIGGPMGECEIAAAVPDKRPHGDVGGKVPGGPLIRP
ncbi:MAG TPA: hypothetical protein PKD27_12585, partial [Tepidiformaceae bacterium]|nr:hypothetical protein [Tepidiformaceae bacterium]